MAGFEISDGTRFAREFELKPVAGKKLVGDELRYKRAITTIMDRMADDMGDDPVGDGAAAARRDLRQERRQRALDELRAQAAEVLAERLEPVIATGNAFVIRGKYLADQDRLSSSLFAVGPKLENGHVVDVVVAVADISVSEEDPIMQAKRGFYVALESAKTIVGAVAQRIEDEADGRTARLEAARALRDRYMTKLVEIARIGLQGPHVELGRLALDGFRAEFVAREAGRIKNSYVKSLGVAGLISIVLCLAIYALVAWQAPVEYRPYGHFLLAAVGAAAGTWLSFSIRRVNLGFDELAVLETDLLEPGLRIIFVTMLTWIVLLFFWTGAMNLEIGQIRTAEMRLATTTLPMHAISLLIGAFCGLSERALATAVSGRASGFVNSVSA